MPARKTIDEYHRLARLRGFKFCGRNAPRRIGHKAPWMCGKGHKWDGRYNDVQQGHGCPKCAGLQRITREEYEKLAENRNFNICSIPRNSTLKATWRCKDRHEWNAAYQTIKRGHGCPDCTRKRRKSESDFAELARNRGCTFIGPYPGNNHTKTWWRCDNGHDFEMCYSYLASAGRCNACVGSTSRSEDVCRTIMEEVFHAEFKTCRPPFLKRKVGGTMELDGYCPSLALAFEYNGTQHTEFHEFFHRGGIELFKQQQERDVEKRRMCADAGIFLVTISAPLNYDTPREIRATILEQTKNWKRPERVMNPNS